MKNPCIEKWFTYIILQYVKIQEVPNVSEFVLLRSEAKELLTNTLVF